MSVLPEGVPWTPTPRSLFKWIPFLSGEAEIKIVFALYELTYGNDHPLGVKLQYADLMAATGLSNAGVRRAVKTLAARGAIVYKVGANTRAPIAFKVVLGWKPTSLQKYEVTKKDLATKVRGAGKSHLNTATKVRGADLATKVRGTSLQKYEVVNTIRETKNKRDSPSTSYCPQGGKKNEVIGDHPETIEACRLWHSEHKYSEAQADTFWHYHEMNGWRQGRAAAPIKKWTSAAHYFHREAAQAAGGDRASPPLGCVPPDYRPPARTRPAPKPDDPNLPWN